MPAVSVIIPTYNYGRFIGAAVQSVLDQTFRDCEIIVVDDGSTDNTAQVVSQFGDRVTYLFQPNRGKSAARNRAIQEATGQWVAFLDADDRWLPSKIERQLEILKLTGEQAAVHSNFSIVNEDRSMHLYWREQVPESVAKGLEASDLVLWNVVGTLTVMVSRDKVLDVGGFDEGQLSAEDWDLWLRMGLAGLQFVYVDEPLAIYRRHGANMQRDIDRMRTYRIRVLDKFFARPDLPPTLRRLRNQAYANVHHTSARARYHKGEWMRMMGEISRMVALSPRSAAAGFASLVASRVCARFNR